MLNVIHFSFVPNTASTQRLISYLVNIPKDIKCRLFFIMPDAKKSVWHDCPDNIEVIYCWRKFPTNYKALRYITYYLSLSYIKRQLKKGDIVYSYNMPPFLNKIFKTGVRYYGERTEHPQVVQFPSALLRTTLKQHINLAKRMDGLFVISTALRDYYIKNGVKEERVHIINMTVDPSRFENIKKQEVAREYMAYCGSASNNKDGVDKLIKAFAIVHQYNPNLDLYIIGPAPLGHDGKLNIQLADSLGLINQIIFTGSVSAANIPQLLKNASVLLLDRPDSLQAQCGFPTKLGEYLLTENPVVITKVGDIPLFLEDEINVLLAPPDDDKEFAEKVIWALTNSEKAKSIGRNGAKVARIHFNAKIETLKLLKIML